MANGKYTKRNRGVASKSLVMVLALVLVIGCTVGATLAYLTDKSGEVKNTFTIGKVDITLTETDNTKPNDDPKEGVHNEYKLVPGATYDKDPAVTVKANSEECYLFVKFEEKGEASKYITYTSLLAAPDWTEGDGVDVPKGVWYRTVAASTIDTKFELLKDNEITIKADAVTNQTMAAAAQAELVYTAYACQTANVTLAQAWAQVSATQTNP